MKKLRPSKGAGDLVAALAVIWTIAVIGMGLAAAYALGVPPWNAPDEPAHYNYARIVATTRELPELKAGDWDAARLEALKSAKFPPSESVDSIRYESHQPPLYYLLSAPAYGAAAERPTEDRVEMMRLLSVALSGVTVILAFFTVRAIFPGDLMLPAGVASFMAFLPMRSAIMGSITNDALAEMVAVLLLLVVVRITRDGLDGKYSLLLGVVLGVALLTKMTLYGLVGLGLLAAATAPWGRGENAPRIQRVLTVVVIALAVSGWWFGRNGMVYGWPDIFGMARHDQVVVGQPRLEALDGGALSYLATTLFKSFWGQFGWMGILMDERLYLALGIVSGMAALGFGLFLWRAAFTKRLLEPYQKRALLFMGLALGVVVAQVAFYNLTFIQAQGRYLYPALLPIALFFVLGLRELMSSDHARLLMALSMGSLAALNLVCLTRFVVPYFQ